MGVTKHSAALTNAAADGSAQGRQKDDKSVRKSGVSGWGRGDFRHKKTRPGPGFSEYNQVIT